MKKMVLIVVGLIVVLLITMGIVIRITNIEQGMSNSEGGRGITNIEQGISNLEGSVLTTEDTNYTKVESEKSAQSVDRISEEISAAVKALLGQDGKKHNYPSLLSAINELDADNISTTDVAALRAMLNFPNDQFPEKMRPIEINAVKNDVLDKLLRQKDLPEGLGLQMVEMAGNTGNDPVWRDYCIQFMEPFYERASGELATESTKGSPDELTAIHDAMFSALEERSETLAGTALIGLEQLSRTHDEFDRELIVEKTVEIASDEQQKAKGVRPPNSSY